jgi:hypothetical protein
LPKFSSDEHPLSRAKVKIKKGRKDFFTTAIEKFLFRFIGLVK